MADKPTILNKTTVAQSRLFHIEAIEIRFSNGVQRSFERLTRGRPGGAVLIVPMLDDDTVLLVREYSAGVHRYELGLPKGKTDPGESFLEAANRELKEEVGFGAHRLHHLSSFSLAPSYLEHMTEIILAEDLYEEKLPGDEPEELEVVPWKLSEINALLATGECTEARSIAALFMALEYLKARVL
ncbi:MULTISPECIES: ADP compounds hydrolase NudE [Methylomicrobium]|uniref:ADP-ribose pyrophosphatase n=1 Tax=Methylomicrobium album BG8 TaxID=686340 RepID=H8GKI4_METAL|nr:MULTISPECIES: ADP compounds hydrolase NudE [Methylomicrobium]EIC27992.1 ADP-ribose pyrophosphatase [Methylomicrobium album BG8]